MRLAMLALTHGFGLSRAAIDELFRGYYDATLTAISRPDPRASFAAAAVEQRERLTAIGNAVFACNEHASRWASAWIEHGRTLGRSLIARGVCDGSSELTPRSATLVTSYLHMFVNRLGLFGEPEAYLCFLARHVCSKVP